MNGAPQARRNFIDGFAAQALPGAPAATHRPVSADPGAPQPSPPDAVAARSCAVASRRGTSSCRGRHGAARAPAARRWPRSRRRWRGLYPALAGRGSRCELEYRSALGRGGGGRRSWRRSSARLAEEMRRGQTLVGPHRDDLAIELDGRDLRTLRLARPAAADGAGAAPGRGRAGGARPSGARRCCCSTMRSPSSIPTCRRACCEHIVGGGQVFLTTRRAALPEWRRAPWWDVQRGQREGSDARGRRGAA